MMKATFKILLTLTLFSLLVGNPALAGMGGAGGRSGGGMGGSGGSGMTSGPSGSTMMDNALDHRDMGSMPSITTGGLGSGDMAMDIKPVRYEDGRLVVKYFANTHSVNLGMYDLMKLSTLEMNGKVFTPVSADSMRGHHAGGRITFEVPEEPGKFRIVIRDIPQVKERVYDWN